MRVYNGTNLQLSLPLSGIQRIEIPAHSVSGDIMPSTEFLSLLVGSYDYSEIALIVSGPFEINMCAGVSGSVGFVVQSLEEAIERFAPKVEIEEPKETDLADKSECTGCHSESCEGCDCMTKSDEEVNESLKKEEPEKQASTTSKKKLRSTKKNK